MTQEPRRLSREESKRVTRHRLLQAGLELLAEEGLDALTTGKVTKRAGIAQPTFYVHFKDMNDLVSAIGEEQVSSLRATLRTLRLQINGGTASPLDIVRETYREPLHLLVKQHGDVLRVLLAEVHRPHSELGRLTQTLIKEVVTDLVEDLVALRLARQEDSPRLHLVCEGLVMLTIHYGLMLVQKRCESMEEVVEILSRTTMAMLMPAFAMSF